jgi:hypothetical protein
MSKTVFWILVLLFAWLLPGLRADQRTDDETNARSAVLELAGAFENDGFKIRDGDWLGKISRDHPEIISVNLYAGNAYWFSAAAAKSGKLKVSIFDDQGKPMHYEPFESDNKAAAGFSPDFSGRYCVKVSLQEGQPSMFCLIYSYK